MKSSLIRPALALALALGLSACGGGGKAEFTVAGTAKGLIYPGLTLSTNGMTITVNPPATPGADVSYSFPNKLEYGDEYNVKIDAEPAHQNCGFAQTYRDPINRDTAGRLEKINVIVECGIDQHTVGGSVTGLTADGLVMTNGSTGGTVTLLKGATSYAFGAPVAYGITYGVTILTQPTGLTCTVANGVGTMGDEDVKNVNVNCVANP
ncbi:hypothetical protein [Massilia sp. ZL223]|uniref:hypothetical protein n=1 Tax=Massilia sp. ZL223 TaxID=2824904 RepID=UPI001B8323AC|nr:hypothetical protein [Massilia sp. ZL223]MBQ5961527.1 hypothetical protein [Massilia sp. ZL223]